MQCKVDAATDVVTGSPGAGKTILLLELLKRLSGNNGVIEADIESTVDSEKIKAVGVSAVQLETNGVCHVDMDMVEQAYHAFGDT